MFVPQAGEDRAALKQTQQTFERLLESSLKAIYGAAYSLTRNQDEAADLVQEAALQAFRAFHTFQPGTNFKAWYLRILTNLFYNQHRKQRRRPQTVDIEEASDLFFYTQARNQRNADRHADPLLSVFTGSDAETITEALDRLPDDYRAAAILYFVDEFSYQEIADMLDCPIGTVRSRIHRGRKLLQKALWHLAAERGLVAEMRMRGT